MERRGHSHIDVLKVDIEGSEWKALAGDLPSIGQLQVEVHEEPGTDEGARVASLSKLFNNIERHGLRLFHKEVNARYNLNCMEFSFIQENWSPSEKVYKH
jgi:hypothetical protein